MIQVNFEDQDYWDLTDLLLAMKAIKTFNSPLRIYDHGLDEFKVKHLQLSLGFKDLALVTKKTRTLLIEKSADRDLDLKNLKEN